MGKVDAEDLPMARLQDQILCVALVEPRPGLRKIPPMKWFRPVLRILVAILVCVGGMTFQTAARTDASRGSATLGASAAMPCDLTEDATPESGLSDCILDTGIDADGSEQICCIDMLSPQVATLVTPVAYATVDYWHVLHRLGGVSHKPDLFPPIDV